MFEFNSEWLVKRFNRENKHLHTYLFRCSEMLCPNFSPNGSQDTGHVYLGLDLWHSCKLIVHRYLVALRYHCSITITVIIINLCHNYCFYILFSNLWPQSAIW